MVPDQYVAGVWLFESGDQPQARGLAGTRWAEHGEEFAIGHLEADIVDGAHVAKVSAHVLELDGGYHSD